MNQYEGMFLFDPTFGASFEDCEAEIRRLMERAAAEIVFCRKWDERRLAYRIKGRKRGVYVLVYFRAAPDKITGLERDVKLAENILRLLVARADGATHEMMEAACAARGEERPIATDGDREDGAPPGDKSAAVEGTTPTDETAETLAAGGGTENSASAAASVSEEVLVADEIDDEVEADDETLSEPESSITE